MKYLIIIVLWVNFSLLNIVIGRDAGQATDYPLFPDLIHEYYMAELNKTTPLDLVYNEQVRRYIEIFTIERRAQIELFMGRAQWYFPIIEDYLQRYGLPLELRYVAVIESGLNPLARSSSNAIGLWQFLFGTSQMFDLQITSYIDERRDIHKSTDAACRYLRYLFRLFGDWNLALAAYNGGPGELERAIIRSGGERDFWKLRPYITEAMGNFVPSIIAINYVFNNAHRHNLIAIPPDPLFFDLDTIHIHKRMTFKEIADRVQMTEDCIRKMNPVYILDEIPNMGQPMTVVLPREKTTEFLTYGNRIAVNSNRRINNILPEYDADMRNVQYIVKQGDFLHKIAMQFGCTIEDIQRWNDLSSNNLAIGMTLNIWTNQ
jgi:membrane-bound lytic murein transglycosylase D